MTRKAQVNRLVSEIEERLQEIKELTAPTKQKLRSKKRNTVKQSQKDLIRRLANTHPNMSLTDIAVTCGVSQAVVQYYLGLQRSH